MDILHSQSVEGFCIISSDSDYTGLAKRIREEGLFVMGIGKKITPIAFVNSCEVFTFSENLSLDAEEIEKGKIDSQKSSKIAVVKRNYNSQSIDLNLIDKAFEISINDNDEALISKVGLSLRKIDPSFDPRTFGFKTLTQLFEKIEKYEVIRNVVNGLNYPLVRLR